MRNTAQEEEEKQFQRILESNVIPDSKKSFIFWSLAIAGGFFAMLMVGIGTNSFYFFQELSMDIRKGQLPQK
jgi:hypothetical protein